MLDIRVSAGQAQEEPAGWGRFPFLSGVTEFFCKVESKFLKYMVIAGNFVMGCAKKVLVSSRYKKVVERSAV